MKKRTPSRAAPASSSAERYAAHLNARQFPALSTFLKGYLHQDFPDEYGSVSSAVAAFCRDASAEERRRLVTELERLVGLADTLPSRVLGRFVTRDLGSAWNPRSTRELADVLAALRART